MTRDELLRAHGFDPAAQRLARVRRREFTLAWLANRGALIATALALAPAGMGLLESTVRAIPVRWPAVLLYTYVVLALVRWPLPLLSLYLVRRDARDGLLPALPRGLVPRALRRHLIITALAIPLFALLYGLEFAPWRETSWNPILYVFFTGLAEFLYFAHRLGRPRPVEVELKRRAEELGKRMKMKPPRLLYLESPGRVPGGAAYLLVWFWEAIVLSRNLRDRLTPRELDVVLAHELAHRKEFWALVVVYGIRVFGAVVGVGYLLPPLCHLYGIPRFEIGTLPLFLAVCEIALLSVSPLERAAVRWAERRADRMALRATEDPDAFASCMVKLYDGNLIDAAPPRTWQLLFGTHPTGIERVEFARGWNPRPGGSAQSSR